MSALISTSPLIKEVVSGKSSILSQIVDQIVNYLQIVSAHPGYITGTLSSSEGEHEKYWEEVLSNLSVIFKQVAGSLKLYHERQDVTEKLPVRFDFSIVQRLCNIILTTELKNKSTQKTVKNILNDIQCFGDEGKYLI